MIDVLLVDDQPLVRTGLRLILSPENGFKVVGECDDGATVADAVRTLHPGVVVMDVRMKKVDGVEATRRLREVSSTPPVLMLTTFDDAEVLSAALRAGVAGFLLKDAPADDLIRATRVVARGGAWLDSAVTSQVLAGYRRGADATVTGAGLAALTPREHDVLRWLVRGAPTAEIVNALEISEYAVESDIKQILAKLSLADGPTVVAFALNHDPG